MTENIVFPSEVDYQYLLNYFSRYRHPRREILKLTRRGVLLRVKKGLYVARKGFAKEPYSREVVANLIYGPSYISLEYALSWYGLIPERVENISNMTTKRSKVFKTPIGEFAYRSLPVSKYALGIGRVTIDANRSALMATPEKALADLLARTEILTSMKEFEEHLFENLRISEEEFLKFRSTRLQEIARVYEHPNVSRLANWIKKHT